MLSTAGAGVDAAEAVFTPELDALTAAALRRLLFGATSAKDLPMGSSTSHDDAASTEYLHRRQKRARAHASVKVHLNAENEWEII
jgi:hypothetical protein